MEKPTPIQPDQNPPEPKDQNAPREALDTSKLKSFFKKHKKKLLIAGAIVVILILLLLLAFGENVKQILLSDKTSTSEGSKTGTGSDTLTMDSSKRPPTAIAKVGNEYIFQEDLDIELANYLAEKNEETKKKLLDKLVRDSIILQSADKEKILAINPAAFNSPGKDYGKRIADIKAIEKKVNSRADQISGGIVSVWFHNYEVPKMGLEKAKQTAFGRLSALHKRVSNKEITIEQAGKIIQNDPSYGELDVGYRVNAFVPFSENKGEHISVDEKFNELLWSLNPGEISPVFLGWNVNGFSGKEEEAFYAFGQVSSKIEDGKNVDFAKWAEGQKKNYEITYY